MDNLNNLFISNPKEIIGNTSQEKHPIPNDHSQVVNELVIEALGENSSLREKNPQNIELKMDYNKSIKQLTGLDILKSSSKMKELKQENFMQIATTLSSESMADGSYTQPIQHLIYCILNRSHENTELLKAYENYHKLNGDNLNDNINMKFFILPPESGTSYAFLSPNIDEHHITYIIRYDGDDNKYSLTTINSGDGIEYHEKNETGKPYTRQTLKNISREKMMEFINNNSNYRTTEVLYKAIDKLEGEFHPKESYTDNEQLGGSCAGRQELLLLKHLMTKEEYHKLKIELYEYSVVYLSEIYKSGAMSTRDKIVYLDSVQRLEKKYQKNGQTEMMKILENAETRIKKDISNSPEKPKSWLFGIIPKLPKNVHPLLKSFVKGLKNFQQGDLVNAKKEIEAFYLIIDSIKDLYDDPNNLMALQIIEKALNNLEKVMFFESFSMEQYNLLVGMLCNFDKLQKKSEFFGLKDKFSTPLTARPSAYELKKRFNRHDFVKTAPWADDWKKLLQNINDDPSLIYLLGLLFPSPTRAFKSIKKYLSN